MVIIISYNKQKWNEYNDSQTTQENLANGAIISANRLNHMETGIGNNDTNKVTDNKNGSITANGATFIPADDSKVVHNSGNEEIGGQKTFDTAPIDKTTGNPYITKSDIPKDAVVNVVTQAHRMIYWDGKFKFNSPIYYCLDKDYSDEGYSIL